MFSRNLKYLLPDVYKKYYKGIVIAFIPVIFLALIFSVIIPLLASFINNLSMETIYIYFPYLFFSTIIATLILYIIKRKITKQQLAIFDSDTEKYKYYIEYHRITRRHNKKFDLIKLILSILIIAFLHLYNHFEYFDVYSLVIYLYALISVWLLSLIILSIITLPLLEVKLKPVRIQIER